jgi:hypothetical protein
MYGRRPFFLLTQTCNLAPLAVLFLNISRGVPLWWYYGAQVWFECNGMACPVVTVMFVIWYRRLQRFLNGGVEGGRKACLVSSHHTHSQPRPVTLLLQVATAALSTVTGSLSFVADLLPPSQRAACFGLIMACFSLAGRVWNGGVQGAECSSAAPGTVTWARPPAWHV